MELFKKILFPVDFSEVSPKIAPWVHRVAEQFDAEIHLLFVARMFHYFTEMYVDVRSVEVMQGEIIQGAEKRMDEFVGDHFSEYPRVKTRVAIGDPAEEILKYVEGEGISLVIMGTHGRKGLERVIFGSVAERVIKISSVPVLSINPHRVPDHRA